MANIDKIIEALQQNLKLAELLKISDPFYVQKYVQEMLDKSLYRSEDLPDPEENSQKAATGLQVIELNDSIIVRTEIPGGLDENTVKLFLSGNLITIKFGQGYKDRTTVLQKPFAGDSITAAVKNHTLEIKIPLLPEAVAEEIEIRY